ncbi:cysteine rich repeat-containing protein [Bdellovibrio reynosensis]|uniref:Cysteine rich repeat-containing protein n=1 Tax=Bdellovibrio reynosensis TaxID=2835041 RepID=A0ABY4CBX0_9BACT|nr:cysteine rich repeat-containing protein [Bdellovibrio reynosensis]UOF02214.1 cysteine rich repeat-containing protein [Bdellovibrio reynosensis]
MIRIILVSALTLGLSSFANAHNHEKHEACAKDRETLCAGMEPGKGLHKCMKENKEKLSAECKAHVETMKEHMKDMKDACQADKEKYCGNVEQGKGRIIKCMKENKDKLSAECKAEIESAKAARKGK